MQFIEQFENVIIIAACTFSAIPVTYVLFRVLKSKAKFHAGGWRIFSPTSDSTSASLDSLALSNENHIASNNSNDDKFDPRSSKPKAKKRKLVFVGAAAGFMAAFLLALMCSSKSYHPEYYLEEEWLLGHWLVLNDSEPQFIASWQFTKEQADEEIMLQGQVWEIDDISKSSKEQKQTSVMTFGPHDINLIKEGKLEFTYRSTLGNGRAKFTRALGFLGTYEDDPARTPKKETDSGQILLHKGPLIIRNYKMTSLVLSIIITIAYSWMTSVLSLYLFKYLESHASVRFGYWVLSGPIAFYYIFYSLLINIGYTRPSTVNISESMLEGEWKIEYTENRDRYGYLEIRRKDSEWELDVALAKQNLNERRARPRTASKKLAPLIYDRKKKQLIFEYESTVGTGKAKLNAASILVGRFSDTTAANPNDANLGGLIAVKLQ